MAQYIEEHPLKTKRMIISGLATVALGHLLLLADGFPVFRIALSLLCHASYISLLRTFPMISTSSPAAIIATGNVSGPISLICSVYSGESL